MTAATVSRRPARPPRSLVLPLGILVFLIITLLSLSDQFGIGFDLKGLIEDFGRAGLVLWREAEEA